MATIANKWQAHRANAKGRRAMQKAITGAGSDTVRLELLAIATRNNQSLMR